MLRSKSVKPNAARYVEALEARQLFAGQSLSAANAVSGTDAGAAQAASSDVSVLVQSTTASTGSNASDLSGLAVASGGRSTSTGSKSKWLSALTDLAVSETPSVWQAGTSSAVGSQPSLGGLTSPDAATDPIRFAPFTYNALGSRNNSLFSQLAVLEWQPGELASGPPDDGAPDPIKVLATTDSAITLSQSTAPAQGVAKLTPTTFGKQWNGQGSGDDASTQWVLRARSLTDRSVQDASALAHGLGVRIGAAGRATAPDRKAILANLSHRNMFDAMTYFAQLGGVMNVAAQVDTGITAQRIQQILLACRRMTGDVVQFSLRGRLSHSAQVAALLLATALARRSSRAKERRGEPAGAPGAEKYSSRGSADTHERVVASGAAMSRSWIWFGMVPPRSER